MYQDDNEIARRIAHELIQDAKMHEAVDEYALLAAIDASLPDDDGYSHARKARRGMVDPFWSGGGSVQEAAKAASRRVWPDPDPKWSNQDRFWQGDNGPQPGALTKLLPRQQTGAGNYGRPNWRRGVRP